MERVAYQMEADFLAANFGRNKHLVEFGRSLIKLGHEAACAELRQTVAVLGDKLDPDEVIVRIRSKYFNAKRRHPDMSILDIATRLLQSEFVDDAEELIFALGGTIVTREVGSGHTVFILRLAHRQEAFNSQRELIQWVIKNIAPTYLVK
jgi:hypothetical protein